MYTTANGSPCVAEPASKVHRDYVPDWFASRIVREYGPGVNGEKLGWAIIVFHADSLLDFRWTDHGGSTIIEDTLVFVGEPYWDVDDDFSPLEKFARSINCRLMVSDKSYHNPGKTIRLAFLPIDLDSVRGERTASFNDDQKEMVQ